MSTEPRVTAVDLALLLACLAMTVLCVAGGDAYAAAAFAWLGGEHAGRRSPR